MDRLRDSAIEAILEQLIKDGPNGVAPAFARLFELAMRIERERFLDAGHSERTDYRRGYANGYKPKRLDTLAAPWRLPARPMRRQAAHHLAECPHINAGDPAENGPAWQPFGAKPSYPGHESNFVAKGNRKLPTFATGL